MKKIGEFFVLFLFLIGLLSFLLFTAWVFSLFIYVFDVTIDYPGEIVFLPKWIFLFSPLALLGKTKTVEKFLKKITSI